MKEYKIDKKQGWGSMFSNLFSTKVFTIEDLARAEHVP
jgi:hypothetical protein